MKRPVTLVALVSFAPIFLLAISGYAQPQERERLAFGPDDTIEEVREKIAHNGYRFTVAPNWVSEMPPEMKEEFFSRRAPLFPAEASDDVGPLARRLGKTALPSSFDWRNRFGHSYIGPVRDQETCGSCYAFAACAVAECSYNIAHALSDGACVDFSEAFLAFCLSELYNGFTGCIGSDYDYEELTALTEYGVCDESAFPYSMETEFCLWSAWGSPRVRFESWHRVDCTDVDAIKTAIMNYGVVDAAVDVTSAFQLYSGGVYEDTLTACTGTPCYYTATNHCIALVGWDDNPPEGGGGCWILRNSWGSTWGENGYMRLRYHAARVSCAVAYLVDPEDLMTVVSPGQWLTVRLEVPPCPYAVYGYDGYSLVNGPGGRVWTVFNGKVSPYEGPVVHVAGFPTGYPSVTLYNGYVPYGISPGDYVFEISLIPTNVSEKDATIYNSYLVRVQ